MSAAGTPRSVSGYSTCRQPDGPDTDTSSRRSMSSVTWSSTRVSSSASPLTILVIGSRRRSGICEIVKGDADEETRVLDHVAFDDLGDRLETTERHLRVGARVLGGGRFSAPPRHC